MNEVEQRAVEGARLRVEWIAGQVRDLLKHLNERLEEANPQLHALLAESPAALLEALEAQISLLEWLALPDIPKESLPAMRAAKVNVKHAYQVGLHSDKGVLREVLLNHPSIVVQLRDSDPDFDTEKVAVRLVRKPIV